MKSHIKLAALAIVMIVSSSLVDAQEGRPTTASPPGTTQGPGESAWHHARALDQCKARQFGKPL